LLASIDNPWSWARALLNARNRRSVTVVRYSQRTPLKKLSSKAFVNSAKAEGAEFDGPTINGHPALRVDDVQQWFKDAFGVVPPKRETVDITQKLNHCELLSFQWRNTPELTKMRSNNPSWLRMQRISAALTTLQSDLPVLIDDTRRLTPPRRTARFGKQRCTRISEIPAARPRPQARGMAPDSSEFTDPHIGGADGIWSQTRRIREIDKSCRDDRASCTRLPRRHGES
jgi:hypothetical protein